MHVLRSRELSDKCETRMRNDGPDLDDRNVCLELGLVLDCPVGIGQSSSGLAAYLQARTRLPQEALQGILGLLCKELVAEHSGALAA